MHIHSRRHMHNFIIDTCCILNLDQICQYFLYVTGKKEALYFNQFFFVYANANPQLGCTILRLRG